MKNYILLLLVLAFISCDVFKPKETHKFVYAFEHRTAVSKAQINTAQRVISKRLNKLGLKPEIKVLGNQYIEIIVKGYQLDTNRLDKIISNPGRLEFWELYPGDTFLDYFVALDKALPTDSIGQGLMSDKVVSRGYLGGAEIFSFKAKDTALVYQLTKKKSLQEELNFDGYKVHFFWGKTKLNGDVPLYAAKSNRQHKPPLTGRYINDASCVLGIADNPEISMNMNNEGALIWERMTEKAFNNQTCIGIVINNIVYSAPRVASGPIRGGSSSISGDFTLEEAQDLAVILASGVPQERLQLQEHSIISN